MTVAVEVRVRLEAAAMEVELGVMRGRADENGEGVANVDGPYGVVRSWMAVKEWWSSCRKRFAV